MVHPFLATSGTEWSNLRALGFLLPLPMRCYLLQVLNYRWLALKPKLIINIYAQIDLFMKIFFIRFHFFLLVQNLGLVAHFRLPP